MRNPSLLACALFPLVSAHCGEVRIESRDGRFITAHLIELNAKAASVVRSDGTQSTIPLDRITDKSLDDLKAEAAKPPGLEFKAIELGMTKAQVKTLAPTAGLEVKFSDLGSDEWVAQFSDFLAKKHKATNSMTSRGCEHGAVRFSFQEDRLTCIRIDGKGITTGSQETSLRSALSWCDTVFEALKEKYGTGAEDAVSNAGRLALFVDYGDIADAVRGIIARWKFEGGIVELYCRNADTNISVNIPTLEISSDEHGSEFKSKPKF